MDANDRAWLAREVIRHLAKAIKMRRLYGARHAHATSALDECVGRLRTFHAVHETLWLEVDRDALRVGEERIAEDSKELALAFGLFVGGARRLAVRPGVEVPEAEALVAALAAVGEDADPTTQLLERDLEHVELVCLDELTEGWDVPENLSELSQRRIDELNHEADALIAELENRKFFGAGDHAYEVSDTGQELADVQALGLAGVHDPDDSDDEGFALPAGDESATLGQEARAIGTDDVIARLVDVALDGLVLAPDALPSAEAQWFLAEAPIEALRREDLSLLARLLERFAAELALRWPAELAPVRDRVADALEWARARVESDEGIEALVKAACGSPIGGPAALCRVARALGKSGTAAVCRIYARTESRDLREALNAFLAELGEIDPVELARLCAPSVPSETARWALFTAGKHLKGEQVEMLYATARQHPDESVREYAAFLFRTQSPAGRLQAFLDTVASPDPQERLRALTALAQARDAVALEPLKKLVDDPSFLQRPPEEKRAFLAAIAAIGGTGSRGFLMRQTERPTGIFQRKAALEVREEAQRAIKSLAERLDGGAPANPTPGARPRPATGPAAPRPGAGALRIRGAEPPREKGKGP